MVGVGLGGKRLGRVPEVKSENYVKTERTVRAKNDDYVGTPISKRHVCVHRMRCRVHKQALCARTALAGGVCGSIPDLTIDFGSFIQEAFVLRTEAAFAAVARPPISLAGDDSRFGRSTNLVGCGGAIRKSTSLNLGRMYFHSFSTFGGLGGLGW